GECAHPCRWEYALVEEKRPGEYFPVVEEGKGTFIFNSRDLCLLPHLPELLAAGIGSLKIEGRMKGIHYAGSVVRVYREALDRLLEEPERFAVREEWMEELTRISHRGYTTGFLFGEPREVGQEYRSRYIRTHDFVGVVQEVDAEGVATVGVRNRLQEKDRLHFLGRGMRENVLVADELVDAEGNRVQVAHPNSVLRLKLPFPTERHDLIRREKGGHTPGPL
ncbi:MAG TPA: U32 family peptidase C-terminal domain-containing protein, partial [Verrucomicrobiae bacterium]|nr:U32 family peptidase C-terminal domain-containing protein [Verrucomicrobiae bacterium]